MSKTNCQHFKILDERTQNTYDVCISEGNAKMGAIPSISLPRIVTCPKDAPCYKDCYMRSIAGRPAVKNTYEQNLRTYQEFEDWYWHTLKFYCMGTRYFRYHVCGDIPNRNYFDHMVSLAKDLPHCSFLCFTKKYGIANSFMDSGKELPSNLIVVFSRWDGYDCNNPYDLPEAWADFGNIPKEVLYKGRRCSHNCSECNARESGCWNMNRGDAVILDAAGHKKKHKDDELEVVKSFRIKEETR